MQLCCGVNTDEDIEPGGFAIPALDSAAAGFYAVPNDRKSEAGAAGLPLPGELGPVERAKDILELTFRQAGAVIGDADADIFPFARSGNLDRAGCTGIADGISNDVGRCAEETLGLSEYFDGRIDRYVDGNVIAVFSIDYLLHEIQQGDRGQLETLLTEPRFGKRE